MKKEELSHLIKFSAQQHGFDLCGITKAEELLEEKENFKAWLNAGYHADMHWMERHFDKRTNPTLLFENVKSIIVVLKNYYPSQYPFENKKYKISRYALGKDYHQVIKKQLQSLVKTIEQKVGHFDSRCYVDSAPIMEKALANKAGLGWIGKNSLLINRSLGSYFFIGTIFTTLEIEYDISLNTNLCGNCTNCIDNCPTKAIVAPKIIDARKCISYHTIENQQEIPNSIAQNMHGWIFGCDICQQVCPWNLNVKPHNEPLFEPSEKLFSITDEILYSITEKDFNTIFEDTAVKRAKHAGLIRNIKNNTLFNPDDVSFSDTN